MTHLLDTDHVTILQHGGGPDHAVLVARLSEHSPEDVGVCVISLHEQTLGAHTRISQARTPAEVVLGYRLVYRIIDHFRRFPLVPFDAAASGAFDALKAAKIRVGTMDLRIAATALSRNLVLVTRNARDFGQVPGLRVEDWTV